MSNVVLKATDVEKIYQPNSKNPVLASHDINLELCVGDFVCVMGPSGSGKSTLINILSTIDMPTKGTVEIYGKNVRKMSETDIGIFRYENLGFIFQSFNLMDTLTMFENIAVPLVLNGVDKEEIKTRVNEMAEKLEIAHLLDKYPNLCSGGQKQRAAIARALVTRPKLIVADEPTGNLDSKTSHEVISLLKKMNEEMKATLLMVTHDPMIASYSQKVLYIKDGEINEVVERKDKSQKDYFYDIVNVNSKESMSFMD